MKRIFRSIINVPKDGNPTISLEDLKKNYRAFLASRVQAEDPSYLKIYHWIEAHFRDYDEVPSVTLLHSRAVKDGDEAILACLKDIVIEQPFVGSDYRSILKEKFEEQSQDRFQALIQDTWKVASSGLEIGKRKKQKVKGIQQAIQFFTSGSHAFHFGSDAKTSGDVRSESDGKEVKKEYTETQKNPLRSVGMYTFLQKFDDTFRGIKPGQLMVIAGYVGQAKTILSANIAYNGIYQGLNGLYLPMESVYGDMRRMFYVLHTSAPKWYEHPKYSHLAGKITYDAVEYAELTEDQQEFYDEAVDDFCREKEGYGQLFVHEMEKRTPEELIDIAYYYDGQLKEKGQQLDFIIPDYVGLMFLNKSESTRDSNHDLNIIIKRMKTLAMTFDNNRKIRVITPFQFNRTGYKEALKNEGIYSLAHLSNANEAERSSDIVVSTFFTPEMASAGIVKMGCLKHRQGALFSPFEAHLNFDTKRLSDFIKAGEGDIEGTIQDIPMDV